MHGYTIVFTNHHTNIVNSTIDFVIDILSHSHYCTSFHVKLMLRIGIPVYTTSVLSVLEGWTDLWDHQVAVWVMDCHILESLWRWKMEQHGWFTKVKSISLRCLVFKVHDFTCNSNLLLLQVRTTLGVVQVVKQLSQMIGICHVLGVKLIEPHAVKVTVWGHMCRKPAASTTCSLITAGVLQGGWWACAEADHRVDGGQDVKTP